MIQFEYLSYFNCIDITIYSITIIGSQLSHNHREYFESLAKELGISDGSISGWYHVKNIQLKSSSKGAKSFLDHYYQGSLFNALKKVFPGKS